MAKFYRLKIISDEIRHRPEMDKKTVYWRVQRNPFHNNPAMTGFYSLCLSSIENVWFFLGLE